MRTERALLRFTVLLLSLDKYHSPVMGRLIFLMDIHRFCMKRMVDTGTHWKYWTMACPTGIILKL